MEQSFLHAHCPTVTLTSFRTGAVPDRQSPGWFPTSPGITRLQLSLPAGRCGLTGRSRNADIAQTGSNRHPRSHPTTPDIRRLDTSELLSLRIHSQLHIYKYVRAFTVPLFYASGLSPYRCSRCPGFHHTAVHMDLPNYPLNTIPQHLYIDSHNTLYLPYKSSMCLSQDRSNK